MSEPARDKTNLDSFARKLDVETCTDTEICQLFLLSFAGPKWSKAYRELYGKSPSSELATRFARMGTVKRIAAPLDSDKDPSHALKKSLKDLKRAQRVLETTDLPTESNPAAFFSRFTQMRALRDAFLSSARFEKTKDKWTPLYTASAYLVAMHGADFQTLWSERFNDHLTETKKILNAFRRQNPEIDEKQFASFVEEYVH